MYLYYWITPMSASSSAIVLGLLKPIIVEKVNNIKIIENQQSPVSKNNRKTDHTLTH